MSAGISLANKCQLLFGCAVVAILTAALSVPWIRTQSLVHDYQFEVARQIADAWVADSIRLGTFDRGGRIPSAFEELVEDDGTIPPLRMTYVEVDQIDPTEEGGRFLSDAMQEFRGEEAEVEFFKRVRPSGQSTSVYRYARAIRASQVRAMRDKAINDFSTRVLEPEIADPLRGILIVDRTSQFAQGQLLTSRIYIIAAGLVGSLLAILVFYLILTKIILSPVRRLRATTDRVQEGDLTIRSEINTGDEFQQLSEAFNAMLGRVEQSQGHLRQMNESLDLKVNELAQANVGLYESNRFKSEFLANVSHELRTPLNSIIGFTELLEEIAQREAEPDQKRLRFLENIRNSGRSLLEMINELLDMAKIEAGRMEVSVEPTSVADLMEGLIGIMRPQAETSGVSLQIDVPTNVPLVETDPGKLQQILYNFLSNAIKFTPAGGRVTLAANRVTRQDNSLGVRLAVIDTGPGVPEDMEDVIFEKFRQIDNSHTREHRGTGLGLAICKELAEMLGASVSFVSKPGEGATFYVDLPVTHQPDEPQPLMGISEPLGRERAGGTT